MKSNGNSECRGEGVRRSEFVCVQIALKGICMYSCCVCEKKIVHENANMTVMDAGVW